MSTPLLSVRDLEVAFRQGDTRIHAVRGVSFDIAPGETLALVGESGSGKSVTALSILKLLPYPAASHPAGQILFHGEDLLATSPRDMRKVRGAAVSMIFQEPMSSLNPLHTVERQITEVLSVHRGMGRAAGRKRALELLAEVGIDRPEDRLAAFPHQLSGGQRQRVMIAMALANEPELLIADEPTTALDVTVQAQILTLLKALQQKRGMAMLFITHDLGIVRRLADRVAVMTEGRIVETGPVAEIFARPTHPYTQKLLAAQPAEQPPAPDLTAPVLFAARDLKVWFPIRRGVFGRTAGHIKAVDGVDVTIREGETLAVVGESGSGKTTLGRALLRLIPSTGSVAFAGNELAGRSWRAMQPFRRDLQIVFQDPFGSLSPRMSVGEIVAEGLDVHFRSTPEVERDRRVVAALTDVGLDPETRFRYPHEFSGGQRQRIAIARVLVLEPRFIVLDEVTSALDMSVQAQVIDLLRHVQAERGLTYLFISHDLRVVRAMANDVVVMRAGRVVESGPAAQILTAPQEDYTKALVAAAFDLAALPVEPAAPE